jgi:drug/metabolite transporter (DMT)-like permease
MRLRDWFTIILVGALFGSSFSLIVVTLHELAPLTIAAGRAVVAAITCWAIFLATGQKLPDDPVLIGKLILLGLLTYALPFILMPITQSHLSSSMIAILNLLLPLLTVLVSHYWPAGERATPAKAIGVAVGLAGALLLSAPTLRAGVDGQIWAICISIGSSVIWAIAFNITRDFRNIPPSAIATVALTGAALFCVPAALLVEGTPTVRYTQTWIAWIVLGVFPTALNFQIMYFMIPRVGTTNFVINAYISPVVAILIGTQLLDERVEWLQLAGMAVIFLGLLLIDGRILPLLGMVKNSQRAAS